MANNGKDTKQTRHFAREIHFVRNGEKFKMHKIDWCEGGLHLAYINTNNVFSIKVGQLTMAHMFQDQLHNPVQKVSTMQHALQ